MRWKDRGRSRNLQDRRGAGGAVVGGSLGIGGILLVLVASLVLGIDPFALLGIVGGGGTGAPPAAPAPLQDASEEPLVEFLSFVELETQETWREMFRASGVPWEDATWVLYRDAVSTACGTAPSAVGPFYCPLDESVYIDLAFSQQLASYGASGTTVRGDEGPTALAYVMAHEIAHHVQNRLGLADEVRRLQAERPDRANELSVAQELQADCYAGIALGGIDAEHDFLDASDLRDALSAAAAVGDDALQRGAGRSVNPEAFTHGSSEQREGWFRAGYETGDPAACDTFAELAP